MFTTKLLINGEMVNGASEFEVIDPSTGKPIASVAKASMAQADSAIAAALASQPAWASTSMSHRRERLNAYADAIKNNAVTLTEILVKEQGKPYIEAADEVTYTEHFVRYFAGLELKDDVIEESAVRSISVTHRPLGVVLGITPWNFPMLIPAFKLAPAVLLGNTFILKPAPSTPLSSLMLAKLANDIFPAGVVNVLTDQNDLGPYLTSHPDIAKITFTGSTGTGKKIMESAASTLKRLTLELGGNDAAIVLGDIDVEATAAKIYNAAFYNAGQACLAIKRIYAEEGVYDKLSDALAALAQKAKVGPGTQAETQMGPIQNRMQFERAKRFLAIANKDGKVIAGGITSDGPGYFVNPTVVRDIADQSELVAQEQFCPILPIVKIASAKEGLARANNSAFGLGGSVWSSDIEKAKQVARQMHSGTVWVNQHLHFGPHIPLSGAKQSGIGVEWSERGLAEFGQLSVLNVAN